MITRELLSPRSADVRSLKAAIFDVDGVLLASPHERAWREALRGFGDSERFTTAMYQAMSQANRASAAPAQRLRRLACRRRGQAAAYAAHKQKRWRVDRGRSCQGLPRRASFRSSGGRLGLAYGGASSSKNANGMMRPIRLGSGKPARRFPRQCLRRDLPRASRSCDFPAGGFELHVDPCTVSSPRRPGRYRGSLRWQHGGLAWPQGRRCGWNGGPKSS